VSEPGEELGPAELEQAANVLAEEAGLSLARGLGPALRDALLAAARGRGEGARLFSRRVASREPAAVADLLEHAVVVETSFFRHPEQLAALAAHLGPRPAPLRLWSAGCASGEEAYSLAIAMLEAGRGTRGDAVLGTDVSERALAAARRAAYGPRALRKVDPAAAARWLEPPDAEGARRPTAPVRAQVSFARHNLVRDPPAPAGAFDAILCRNVLIYFEPVVAAGVLRRLADALRPGGALVLGPVELPLAAAVPLDWVEREGATLLVRPG